MLEFKKRRDLYHFRGKWKMFLEVCCVLCCIISFLLVLRDFTKDISFKTFLFGFRFCSGYNIVLKLNIRPCNFRKINTYLLFHFVCIYSAALLCHDLLVMSSQCSLFPQTSNSPPQKKHKWIDHYNSNWLTAKEEINQTCYGSKYRKENQCSKI